MHTLYLFRVFQVVKDIKKECSTPILTIKNHTACPFIFVWPWHGVKPIRLLKIFVLGLMSREREGGAAGWDE